MSTLKKIYDYEKLLANLSEDELIARREYHAKMTATIDHQSIEVSILSAISIDVNYLVCSRNVASYMERFQLYVPVIGSILLKQEATIPKNLLKVGIFSGYDVYADDNKRPYDLRIVDQDNNTVIVLNDLGMTTYNMF